MKNNFKSAVAFFFLFFLHGFSIGNGQQGISYNVIGLGEEADLKVESFSLAQMPIESTNVQFSTKPLFCQTPVIHRLFIKF
jgi:hypothetical protein